MKTRSTYEIAAALFCFGVVNLTSAANHKDSVVAAVFSRSYNNYERPARADGSPGIQTYVVAKGGYAPGEGKDSSIDDVKFSGIVRVLGHYLAKQGYYPAKDGPRADLMLVVHWGKTTVDKRYQTLLEFNLENLLQSMSAGASQVGGGDQGGQSPEEYDPFFTGSLYDYSRGMRSAADQQNANLLGYADEKRHLDPSFNAFTQTAYDDLLSDVESERYYITITAFDFQDMLRHKHKKGLWRTVVSIDAHDNRFDEKLMAMVDQASSYFGRDSGRLIRDRQYTPHISFGELKVLGVIDGNSAPKK